MLGGGEESKTAEHMGKDIPSNGNAANDRTTTSTEGLPLIEQDRTVVYKKRWLMLFVYSLNTAMCGCLFISLSPITNIVSHYYHVRPVGIEWMTNMCVLGYVVLALPATYFIGRCGMRRVLLSLAACNFVAMAIRLPGYKNDRFYLVIVSQFIAMFAFSAVLQMPGKLSSQWFPERERATATSIGVVMSVFGTALGFIQTTHMVSASTNKNVVQNNLKWFYISQLLTSAVILLTTFLYQEKPPTPPSNVPTGETPLSFTDSLKLLWRNKYFIFLSQSWAIYIALWATICVIVNPLLTTKFRVGYERSIGWMGFWNSMAGIVAFLVVGRLLDRYQKYRLTSIVVNAGATFIWLVFIIVFTYTNNFTALYVIYLCLGVCFLPFYASGIEQAAEMTYPVSEETSSSIMLVFSNIYCFILIFAFGVLLQASYVRIVGYSIAGLYFISTMLAALAKTDLRRMQSDAYQTF